MPHLEISELTFRRLQELAAPLVDTPSSVIDRLIDSYQTPLICSATEVSRNTARDDATRKFDPANPPVLTFTKLRKASIGGKNLDRPNWAELVRASLEIGVNRLGFDDLRAVTDANIVKGARTVDGYSYIPQLDISLQGEDAQDCWNIAFGLARKLALPICAIFEWRDKEGAAHPGQIGEMRWAPLSSV